MVSSQVWWWLLWGRRLINLLLWDGGSGVEGVASACRIAAGKQDKLDLGNIDIQRDWGWAEDYVEAMYLMLQQERSDDYAIATGESYELALFIEIAFRLVG